MDETPDKDTCLKAMTGFAACATEIGTGLFNKSKVTKALVEEKKSQVAMDLIHVFNDPNAKIKTWKMKNNEPVLAKQWLEKRGIDNKFFSASTDELFFRDEKGAVKPLSEFMEHVLVTIKRLHILSVILSMQQNEMSN